MKYFVTLLWNWGTCVKADRKFYFIYIIFIYINNVQHFYQRLELQQSLICCDSS